jgi:small multidrug resistance pump
MTMTGALELAGAIAIEIISTLALRASDGFSRLVPSLIAVVGYPLCFYLLSLVLTHMTIGVAYAVWSGVGTAVIVAIGVIAFGETLTAVRIVSLGLVIIGVIGLQLGGTHR